MPKISQNKKGGKIIYDMDDYLGGLHPKYTDGASGFQRDFENTIATATAVTPYRFLGSISPGYAPSSVTNESVVTAFLRNGVVNGAYGYLIGNNELIQQLDLGVSGALTSPAFRTISAHGGHNTVVGNDIILYTANVTSVSTLCAFYSWSDNTDWDVGRYTFAAFIDNFMSGGGASVPSGTLLGGGTTPTLASGVGKPHPMIVGHDDVLYIGDQRYVHAYDGSTGADGTFSIGVLILPAGFRVTAFAKVSPRNLAIFAYRPSGDASTYYQYGEAKCFIWDYLSQDPDQIIDLSDNYVSEAFEYKGTIGCFTQGRIPDASQASLQSKMQIFNGSTFDVVASFNTNAPIHGGVDIAGDIIRWNSEGNVYSWGAPFNGLKNVLNKIEKGSGSTTGFLRVFNNTTTGLLISSGAGSGNGGLERLTTGYKDTSEFSLPMASPIFPEGKRGRVVSTTITFSQVSSAGRGLGLTLVDSDGGSTTVFPSTGGNSISAITASNIIKKYKFDNSAAPLPPFNDIKPYFTYSSGSGSSNAPIIRRTEIEYEHVNIEGT